MNNVISPVTVDLVQPSIVRRLYAKQGDDGRGLLVTLTENGAVYDPTGSAARMFIQKADGTQVYADCTITAGKILAMLPESALTAAGAADIELEMSTASQVITTPIAQLIVLPSNRSGIVSTAEFQALTTALEELEDIKQNVLTPTTALTYTTPSSYSAPQSGDTVQTLFGKITKGLSDIFVSLAQKLDASKVIASTNITQSGFVMDGKTCSDAIAQLNSNMQMHYLSGTGCSAWYNSSIVILQLNIANATINAGSNRFNMLALPAELKLKSANFARCVLNTLSSGWAPDGNQIYLNFDSESQSPYIQATGGKSLSNVQIQGIIIFPTDFFI